MQILPYSHPLFAPLVFEIFINGGLFLGWVIFENMMLIDL